MAVVLAALVVAFFTMFAVGEGIAEGWGPLLGHLVQALVALGLVLAALRWPRAVGLVFVVFGAVYALKWHWGVTIPILLLGLLFILGRPPVGRVTYAILFGIPLIVAVATVLIMVIVGPLAE